MNLINWEILGSPLNWLIVVLVLIFVAYGAFVIINNAEALNPGV